MQELAKDFENLRQDSDEDASRHSNTYNLRKVPSSQKPLYADPFIRPSWGSHSNDNYASWLSELENDFQVGLSAENGYATSLARFAADLGPVVWKIASKKLKCLPRDRPFTSNCFWFNLYAASRSPLQGNEDAEPETVRGPSSQNDSTSAPAHQLQLKSLLHSGTKLHHVADAKPTKFANSSANAMAMVSHGATTNAGLQQKPDNEQDFLSFPPDLNVRFPAPGSPSSSLPIGSPQRPDLALQL
ncbi:hypothetical protein F3Y22_tig00110458pilonHSYRG00269 [Hibiscus syriacus]|uniref:Uncharacterized protein n=1 Tax=Hibiscus syriacus TaxID=106335 RepID=A0A6A3AI39_HIBSY|nr:hypothetical protein F3Y22_tig00110458pilonHSYRG00269 [Hibiscus syriacus]